MEKDFKKIDISILSQTSRKTPTKKDSLVLYADMYLQGNGDIERIM